MTKKDKNNHNEASFASVNKWFHSFNDAPLRTRIGSVAVVAALALTFYGLGRYEGQAISTADGGTNAASVNKNNIKPTEVNTDTQDETDNTFQVPSIGAEGNGTIMKRVDGVWQFSTDNGKTWTDEAPEGVTLAEDGTVTWRSEDGQQVSEFNPADNQWRYSEDGGETWTDPLQDIEDWISEGFTMSLAEGVLMKLQDGKMVYSTDGGETWTEEKPEGLDTGDTVLSKTEDGKTLYSTDGGETWTEEKPEGVEIPTMEDIMDFIPEEFHSLFDDVTSTETAV